MLLKRLIIIFIQLLVMNNLSAQKSHPKNIGIQVLPKDSFPVLNNPKFVDISTAERKKYISDNDAVIGIVINEVAKAYSIKVMGIHELANDYIAETPIAVTW